MSSIIAAVLVIGGIGLIFGCLLAYASVIFKVEKDPRIDEIAEVLPGANCGACGYAGCTAYASAVAEGKAPVNGCAVGKDIVAQKIADVMGVEAADVEKRVAKVHCGGKCGKANEKYEYYGVSDCIAASKLAGGAKACPTGCLGLGSCVNVCQFGAISVVDGVAVVDSEKCTACGQCVSVCPKHLIDIVPDKSKYWVMCRNSEKGADTNKHCTVGCIGCKICEKNCPEGAITVTNNYAQIDYSKCVGCGICAEKCPKKVICKKEE